jgi:hypothetical protein
MPATATASPVPVYVAGNTTIHAGRVVGRYGTSGSLKYRKICGQSHRDRHDAMPVGRDVEITCKRCIAKLKTIPSQQSPAPVGAGNPTPKKEAEMAKVKTRKSSTKPAAKAETNGSTRRTREEIDALVPEFVAHLQGGGTMQDLKAEFGFSSGQPVRQALARNGYDSKGNALESDAINETGAKLKKVLIRERKAGESWYRLAIRVNAERDEDEQVTESALREMVGDLDQPRYYRSGGEAEEAAPAATKTAAKPTAKRTAGRKPGGATKAAGTKQRRAVKADPSPQA